jgi:hypothetical protein
VRKGSSVLNCSLLTIFFSFDTAFAPIEGHSLSRNSEELVPSDHHNFGLEPECTNSSPGKLNLPRPTDGALRKWVSSRKTNSEGSRCLLFPGTLCDRGPWRFVQGPYRD